MLLADQNYFVTLVLFVVTLLRFIYNLCVVKYAQLISTLAPHTHVPVSINEFRFCSIFQIFHVLLSINVWQQFGINVSFLALSRLRTTEEVLVIV